MGFLPAEVLAEAQGSTVGLVGPSTQVTVPGVLDEDTGESPIGASLDVLLVDLELSVAQQFRLPAEVEELAATFSAEDPFATPESRGLLNAAREWAHAMVVQDQELSEGWYSAEGAAAREMQTPPKRPPRRRAPNGGTDTDSGTPKAKRPTTASLQASLDSVLQTLPELTTAMTRLAERQASLESQVLAVPSVSRSLAQPLSSQVPAVPKTLASIAHTLQPPPKTNIRAPLVSRGSDAPEEVLELEAEKVSPTGPDLARMAQSTAITTLVAQLASSSSDPMTDLQTAGGAGVRGSAGRSRLQAELAQQKGLFEVNVQEDGPNFISREVAPGAHGKWSLRDEIPGALWGLWTSKGAGADHVPGDDHNRFHDGRKLVGCKGYNSSFSGDDRAGGAGFRALRGSSDFDAPGGCAFRGVHEQAAGSDFKGTVFRAFVRSKMDHNSHSVSEGARHDHIKEDGVVVGPKGFNSDRQSGSGQPKSKGKRERKAKGSEQPASRGGDRLIKGFDDGFAEKFLAETSSFLTWSICMPRWVLKTRTSFAWHLRRSFSIKWRSSLTSTAVLPLPVPYPGIFTGSGPGLSRKRLSTLAKKRLVHVLVIILDYLFLGRFPTVEELGRQPSPEQRRCLQRLFTFATACGSRSEEFPVAPGRSGPELIACLDKLERFIEASGLSAFGYGASEKVLGSGDAAVQKRQKREHPQLQPYRSLDVDRLKITGQGKWPLGDYLESDLWLAYVEPRSLLHGCDVSHFSLPSFESEDRSEYLKLAKRWDELGLLHLHEEPVLEGHFCKVFNTFKSEQFDRQIGDRRIPNAREFSAGGPSRHLPTGPHLLGFLLRRGQKLLGSLTDRRDFYHQAEVSRERSRSNMVPFSYSKEELSGLSALADFVSAKSVRRRRPREETGDHFEKEGLMADRCDAHGEFLFPSFAALFQGDHLGVEFALEAHQNLLVREGLLNEASRIRGHAPLPLPPLWEGLIIDDYFVIGSAGRCQPRESTSVFLHLAYAREAYARHGLPGSPEKDVVAEDLFKAAGAEVDSRDSLVTSGLCLVGAPLSKRLGLSLLSLRAAQLPAISSKLASRLSGSWVSVLLYRRCFSAIVREFFALASTDNGEEKVFHLPRTSAEELAMLAAVAPFIASDISAPVLPEVFATDASLQKGAICRSPLPQGVADRLWLEGDRKGSYTQLENGFRAALRAVGEFSEEDAEGDEAEPDCGGGAEVFGGHEGFFRDKASIEKPPLFSFDFVEVFGGAGQVAWCMSQKGFVVGPVLDISMSAHYDLRSLDLLRWLIYMLENERIRSMLIEPPCTTFSPAAHPACRSYEVPLGWDRTNPKVLLGNVLAFRSLTLIYVCHRLGRPAGLEQSRLSKMAWLAAWRWLLSLGCEEAVVASCMFLSPHRKEFRLLLTGLDAEALTLRCSGGHKHVRIEGKLTKPSAVYTDGVAQHFANAFEKALRRQLVPKIEEREIRRTQNLVVNDILRSCPWEVGRSWFWKTKVHINLLEVSVAVSLMKQMMQESPDCRFSLLLDSAVAKGALSKGRSSSRGLQPLLRRAAACQVAGSLYPSLSHAPTKLNVADDPTREVDLRESSKHALFALLDLDLYRELGHQLLSPATANWVRLTLLLCLLQPSSASSHVSCFTSLCHEQERQHLDFSCWLQVWIFGLGLICLAAKTGWFGFWTFRSGRSRITTNRPPKYLHLHSRSRFPLLSMLMFAIFWSAVAPIAPETSAELERARRRQHVELAADRVLRKETRENRARLLQQFETWLWQEHLLEWGKVVATKTPDPEEICKWLVAYGRDLHAAGKSYTRYAETINAIGTLRPIVKRQLTAAWDLAFAWLVDEPHQHHPALPLSVLLAVTALALYWGWPLEAAIFSMTWSGLLRIGEVVSAVRRDLVLPDDSAPGINYILLKIHEPKARGRGAKHQSARIEPTDIVRLVTAVFRRHSPSQKLWPFSAQTLRRRFNQLLAGVGLPTKQTDGVRPYDLGSLRPGGATHLLNLTEDCSLVQRRGRWLSYKVMTIYLQEITVATSVRQFSEQTKSTIENLNSVFPQMLETAILYLEWQIPCTVWYLLFRGGATGV